MGLYRIEDSDRIYSAKVPNLGRCVRADHDAEHDIILLYRTTLVNSGAKIAVWRVQVGCLQRFG